MKDWKHEIQALKWWLITALVISTVLLIRWILNLNDIIFMPLVSVQEFLFIALSFTLVGIIAYIVWRLFRLLPSILITTIFAVIVIGFLSAIEFALQQNGWFIVLSLPWIILANYQLNLRYRQIWLVSFIVYMVAFVIVQVLSSTIPSLLVLELIFVALIFGATLATPYVDIRKVVMSEILVVMALPFAIVAGYAVSSTVPWVLTATNSQQTELTAPDNQVLRVVQTLKPCELCANVQSLVYEPLGFGFYHQVGVHHSMQFLDINEDDIVWVDVSPTRYQVTIDGVSITLEIAH